MIAKRFFAARTIRWSSRIILLFGLIWGLQAPTILAQKPVVSWEPFATPPGRISLLAQDTEDQTLYAVSVSAVRRHDDLTQWRDSGTPHKSHALYLSTDRGATWHPASNNLVHGAITALCADPVSHSVLAGLYETGDAETRRDGLWRSDDDGAHWRQVDLGRNDLNVRRIIRNADNTLLLLGAFGGDRYASSYVYISRDDGNTWQSVEALPFEDGSANILRDFVAHPVDPNRLFLTTYGGDLYNSKDGGITWALSPLPTTFQDADPGPALLAIDPARPELMLLARNVGVGPTAQIVTARSQDGGASWRSTTPAGLPEQGEIASLTATGSGGYLFSAGAGSYRSTDQGTTWQPLEGALSGGSVAEFLPLAGSPRAIIAAGGYGLFVSRDGGGLWQSLGSGLPANLGIVGLLTDARQPGTIFGIPDQSAYVDAARPPALLRSNDGGRTWMAAAQGLPGVQPGAWTLDAADPNTVFIAAEGAFSRSANGGLTWEVTSLPPGARTAMATALSDPNTIYLGGYPFLRSNDRGATWQTAPVVVAPQEQQTGNVTGIVVDPVDALRLWASMEGGVYESRDGGKSWSRAGLDDQPVRWLTGVVEPGDDGVMLTVYAGVDDQGIYRRAADASNWTPVGAGLPTGSTFLSLQADPQNLDVLWTNRDGGGLYRSLDGGESWTSIGDALGDNLVTALAADPRSAQRVLAATATAGIWGESSATGVQGPQDRTAPTVDARIEILWPHDWAPVSEAQQANLSLRLFQSGSLLPPDCTWSPAVTIWQATNNEPAAPIGQAEQRTVLDAPFPVWELNDVDISPANDPETKLFFMTRVAGADSATAVWAHAADARTFMPFPAQPSGIASPTALRSVDTHVQVVWPHDEAGQPQPAESATLANVSVAVFDHGTRLSVPASWRPRGITLYGAWDNEIARPLSRQATVQMKKSGAITYPTWEFTNIPVERASDPGSKLYLWVMVEGLETYPAIWSHGADARTIFPATDQPIQGCLP